MLVFDQFEELLHLGARDEAVQQKYEMFFTELSDLVENHPPARVRERLRINPERVANLDFGPADARVLFSLREDYLANLETYSELIPSIWSNRMRLTRMNGCSRPSMPSFCPAPNSSRARSASKIVHFVAAAGQRQARADGAGLRWQGLRKNLMIEPALLSLFCRELNAQRITQGLPKITADLVKKAASRSIKTTTRRVSPARTGAPESLSRKSCSRQTAIATISNSSVPPRCSKSAASRRRVSIFIDRRLLHLTRRGETLRIED